MRPLLLGIVLFLIWASLATWFYTSKIFPLSEQPEETIVAPQDTLLKESPPEPQMMPEKPEGITLYFEYNKSEILPSVTIKPFLEETMEYLAADTSTCLVITGHTCSIGTESYNMKLGMERANAARNYFREHGLSSACIEVSSKGEAEPVANNSNEAGRKKNRRVELSIK